VKRLLVLFLTALLLCGLGLGSAALAAAGPQPLAAELSSWPVADE